jgi:hypothetical protein
MPHCYTNQLSAYPGETITLHASAAKNPCTLEIARVGVARDVVLRQAVTAGDHAIPDHADRDGCNWPVATEIIVGAEWRSGYYDIVLTDAAGDTAHHFVCVKPAKRPRSCSRPTPITPTTILAAPTPIATSRA